MKNIELAKYYGVSPAASSKWPAERKRRAIIEAEAGVSPEVKRLIGELAGLCYVGGYKMAFDSINLTFSAYEQDLFLFSYIAKEAPLNALALQGAIAKLEDIIYG